MSESAGHHDAGSTGRTMGTAPAPAGTATGFPAATQPSHLISCPQPLAKVYSRLLSDIDGVCLAGALPIPHAVTSLAAARQDSAGLIFVTNNASRLPRAVAERLTDAGIPANPASVLTSALVVVNQLRDQVTPGAKLLVVGSPGLRQLVVEAGFVPVDSADDHPSAVVQGFDPHIGWADLAEAAYAIDAGARHFATNLDMTLPTERGLAPGNGCLVAAVRWATGVIPTAAGKPGPDIYRQAAALAPGQGRVLCIGDRLDTDIAGAKAAGFASLLVLTGVTTAAGVALAPPNQRPDFLAWDLRALNRPHLAPALNPDWWECDGSRARWENSEGLVVQPGPDDAEHLGALRAGVQAVWAALDAGCRVDGDQVGDALAVCG